MENQLNNVRTSSDKEEGQEVVARKVQDSHRGTKCFSLNIMRCMKGQAELHSPPPPRQVITTDPVLNGGEVTPPAASITSIPHRPGIVTRKDFPADFIFGCSTSAIQTEGSGTEGGRGPSTWDGFIQDGTGGTDIAVDSYHRYKEDVQLLKAMGVDSYRFSISWSRILPDGTVSGGINQQGIDFYDNLINELLQNGIAPFATLFHFDLPTALQDKYKGFLSSQIVDDFRAYADVCFQRFGDRVKFWTTINEPQTFGQEGYRVGLSDPNANPVTDPFSATHNIILAHAAAAGLYKDNYQVLLTIRMGLICRITGPQKPCMHMQTYYYLCIALLFLFTSSPQNSQIH